MTLTSLADLRNESIAEQLRDSNQEPSNEEMKVPSNEGRLEGAHVDTPARRQVRTKAGATVRTGARGKDGTEERAQKGTVKGANEDWLGVVLDRAKEGDSDDRAVLSRLNVDIDEDLHLRLKAHCLKNRTTLRKLVPVLLAMYLEQAGD